MDEIDDDDDDSEGEVPDTHREAIGSTGPAANAFSA